MDGFDGLAEADLSGEPELAIGTVTGYRWWILPGPDFRRPPLDADAYWVFEPLHGRIAPWTGGVNEAECRAPGGPWHDSPPPEPACGDGFWGYWQIQPHYLPCGPRDIPAVGVIRGWGRTLTGEKGFRCAKARIIALSPMFELVPEIRRSGWFDPLAPPPGPDISSAERDRLGAWMAVISDRLAQLYPEARVFEKPRAMLACFPAGENVPRLP